MMNLLMLLYDEDVELGPRSDNSHKNNYLHDNRLGYLKFLPTKAPNRTESLKLVKPMVWFKKWLSKYMSALQISRMKDLKERRLSDTHCPGNIPIVVGVRRKTRVVGKAHRWIRESNSYYKHLSSTHRAPRVAPRP